MLLTAIPFGVTDWNTIEPTEHVGESGVALWRTCQFGAVRVRVVHDAPHRSSSRAGARLFIVD
jgi:hypothetical protein